MERLDATEQSLEVGNAPLSRWLRVWLAVLVSVFVAALFYETRQRPIQLWDESRNLNNALEMSICGRWMVPMYEWVPDHWNTKPPLLIWMIAALIRLGISPEVALRLPSEVCSLCTVAVVFEFCRRFLRMPFSGIVAALLMTSSTLFFGYHLAISGDYDSLLCLLITLYALGFWVYVERAEGREQAGLLTAGSALAAAALTKSIAGLLPLPGLFVFLMLSGRALRTLKDWRLWATLAGSASVIALYYGLRNHADPQYITAVWNNELIGRFSVVNEGHHLGPATYILELLKRFEPGFVLLPLGVLAFFRKPSGEAMYSSQVQATNSRIRSVLLFTGTVPLVFLLILSKSATRLNYYCAPAVPLLAIFAALGLTGMLSTLRLRSARLSAQLLQGLIVFILSVSTDFVITRLRGNAHVASEEPDASRALRTMQKNGATGTILLFSDGVANTAHFEHYRPIALFSATEARRRGMAVELRKPADGIQPGTWIVTCDPASLAWLDQQPGLTGITTLSDGCRFGKSGP